jgi:hypothetical protein
LASAGTAAWNGKLEVKGTFTQTPTGSLRMFIDGPVQQLNYSFLQVDQTASLSGTLEIVLEPELNGGYLPSVGDKFDMIFASEGITLPNGPLTIETFVTEDGAPYLTALGVTLLPYSSGYAADPNVLEQIPENLFTYAIIDNGTTLEVTMVESLPEPASLTFVIMAGAMLIRRQRCHRLAE